MSDSDAVRLVVFRIGAERFAVPLADVDEVIDAPSVRPIPDAAACVLGLATIAGQFLVVYDPRPLLDVGGRIEGAALLFIHDGRRMAVAVDDVYDAISVTPDEIKPSPVAAAAARFVRGLVRRGSDLIALIDSRALLDAAMHAHADGGERKRT
jgi:purine-binding chemotaxis protein CheW